MFCRSCWVNLPDGTERCPKCQNDPRVAVAPTPPTPVEAAPAAPLPRPVAPRSGPGHRSKLVWVNVALATALGLLIAGPLLSRWWEERQTAFNSTDGAPLAAAPAPLSPPPLSAPTLPRSVQPTLGSTGDEADVRDANEAYALFQRGD